MGFSHDASDPPFADMTGSESVIDGGKGADLAMTKRLQPMTKRFMDTHYGPRTAAISCRSGFSEARRRRRELLTEPAPRRQHRCPVVSARQFSQAFVPSHAFNSRIQ